MRLKTLVFRLTAVVACTLLGWFGARSFQRSASSDSAARAPESPLSPRGNPAPALNSTNPPIDAAVGPRSPAPSVPLRLSPFSRWETWSNALAQSRSDARTDPIERQTLATALSDLPRLVPLQNGTSNAPGVLAADWDPTGRRRIEIRTHGRVWSVLPVSNGQADDLLELEHPAGVAASSLLGGLGATNHLMAVRYSNRDCLLWDTELAVVLLHLTNVPPQAQLSISADGSLLGLVRPDSGWAASRRIRRGKAQATEFRVDAIAASAAAPSPSGQIMALVGKRRDSLWLTATMDEPTPRSIPVSSPVSDVAWSTDGQWLVLVEGNHLLTFREARSLALIQSIMLPGATVAEMKVIPGKPGVLTLDAEGTLRLWSPFAPECLGQQIVRGNSLWIDSNAERVEVRNTGTGETEAFRLDWGSLRVELLPDASGDRIVPPQATFWDEGGAVAIAPTGEVLQWDVKQKHAATRQPLAIASVLQVARSSQPATLWAASSNRVFRGLLPGSVEPGVFTEPQAVIQSERTIRQLSLDATGSIMALLHEDRIALRGPAARLREIRQPEPLESLVLSPNAELLAVSALRGTIRVYASETGRELGSLPAHPHAAMAFARDNERLVLGQPEGYSVWSVKEGTLTQFFRRSGRGGGPSVLALAANTDRLVVADAEGWIQVHAGPRFEIRLRLQLFTQRSPISLALSPEGRWLCAMDGTVIQVWDLKERMDELGKQGMEVPDL